MSYKNQLIKQVTDGKYDRKKYINMVNKKNNSTRNKSDTKNNYRSNTNNIDQALIDLVNSNKSQKNELNKTLEDYNKPDTPENKSPELISENDPEMDNGNSNKTNTNNKTEEINYTEEKFTESNPRKPNRIINKNSTIRNINTPIKNNPYLSRDSVNKQLTDKISLLEAKIDKLEAKIKILNLQMNSILQNDS
ncbi:hypothetical protein QJ854_gp591 [Moumouvirus goulette]|uniref:Repeat protein n=1 Tax=Moumouvirus goulette TaxID=1247379 RepID=M1PMK0_9VIRU|nr:hypothetical protein QJ854_gp591 [Moumouvirus goulette]AGF85191.1 hypothetical protein glt_00382 [Moumouvirus goulette]